MLLLLLCSGTKGRRAGGRQLWAVAKGVVVRVSSLIEGHCFTSLKRKEKNDLEVKTVDNKIERVAVCKTLCDTELPFYSLL